MGQINAITGKSYSEKLSSHSQDYVVIPKQQWLDGINSGDGTVKQFVAMPLGQGYTIEAQITDEEKYGGFQLVVFDPIEGRFPERNQIVDDRIELLRKQSALNRENRLKSEKTNKSSGETAFLNLNNRENKLITSLRCTAVASKIAFQSEVSHSDAKRICNLFLEAIRAIADERITRLLSEESLEIHSPRLASIVLDELECEHMTDIEVTLFLDSLKSLDAISIENYRNKSFPASPSIESKGSLSIFDKLTLGPYAKFNQEAQTAYEAAAKNSKTREIIGQISAATEGMTNHGKVIPIPQGMINFGLNCEPSSKAVTTDSGGKISKYLSSAKEPLLTKDLAIRLLALPYDQQTSPYGDSNAQLRLDIIELLEGVRYQLPEIKANDVRDALIKYFKINKLLLDEDEIDKALRSAVIGASDQDHPLLARDETTKEESRIDLVSSQASPPEPTSSMSLFSSPAPAHETDQIHEMGIAAGGSLNQQIYPDNYGIESWDPNRRRTLKIHMINSVAYKLITGQEPPSSPITIEDYKSSCIPWFSHYDEIIDSMKSAGNFNRILGVETIEKRRGINDHKPISKFSISPELIQRIKTPDIQEASETFRSCALESAAKGHWKEALRQITYLIDLYHNLSASDFSFRRC